MPARKLGVRAVPGLDPRSWLSAGSASPAATTDTTTVLLGLPVMTIDTHSEPMSVVWVIVAQRLVLTVASSQVGRVGDMFGCVRTYQLGFGVFRLGSLRCGPTSRCARSPTPAWRVSFAVAPWMAASAIPRWAGVATFLGTSRLPDAPSAACVRGMRSALLAAVPLALARSLVLSGAKARPA